MNNKILVQKMLVVGVGLIGGSFALALKQAGVVGKVVGVGRNRANLQLAIDLGVIDEIAESLESGADGADLVFISVPVCAIPTVLADLAPYLSAGCVVTDGGSVKGTLVEECESLMPEGCFFVGGHPIAGTEHSGAGAAFATLYHGKRCILTPNDYTDENALELVSQLWQISGAIVCTMDATRHDRIFAEISHLPHVVAYSLVHAVGTADVEGENVLSYTAGGFRDFTRIASSDPAMWRDIALMNREALLRSIDGFSASLNQLRKKVESGDGAGMAEFFTIAKQFRDQIV